MPRRVLDTLPLYCWQENNFQLETYCRREVCQQISLNFKLVFGRLKMPGIECNIFSEPMAVQYHSLFLCESQLDCFAAYHKFKPKPSFWLVEIYEWNTSTSQREGFGWNSEGSRTVALTPAKNRLKFNQKYEFTVYNVINSISLYKIKQKF